MKAFITGSRAYGTPRPDSDLDIVMLVSQSEAAEILAQSVNNHDALYQNVSSCSVRFGSLNLIVLTKELEYQAWEDATSELIATAPVTREEAITCIKRYLNEASK